MTGTFSLAKIEAVRLVEAAFVSRAALAAALLVTPVQDGKVYFAGRLGFLGETGATEIADLPGLVPMWHPSPAHYSADTETDGTAGRAAWLAADAFALLERGRIVVLDADIAINAPISVRAPHQHGSARVLLSSDFAGAAGSYCVRVGEDSSALNDGKLDARLFVDGTAYFGKAFATWLPSSGSFPSGSVSGNSYKALDGGTINGVTFVEGDILRAVVSSASTSVYANNWVKVPTGLVATNWSPAGGSFPSGATAGAIYKATDRGVVDSIPFRPGDYIRALVGSASTTTLQSNWRRVYNGIAAVRIEGAALGHAEVSVDARNCDIAVHLLGNTERIDVSVAGSFCHGLYFESSYETSNSDSSSPDNVYVRLRGASCGWWTLVEGTTVSEHDYAVQNQLANYAVPAYRDYATRVRTLRGCMRTPRYSPAIYISQRTGPSNSGVMFSHFELTNPVDTGNFLHVEAVNTGLSSTERGVSSLSGNLRVASPKGGMNIERDTGSELVVVVQNPSAGTMLKLGDTGKSTISTRSHYTIQVAENSGATALAQLDYVSDGVLTVRGTALPITATTVTRCEAELPVNYLSGSVAYPNVTGLAVRFPAARKAFRTTASGNAVTTTFSLGGGGTGGNSYARTSYIVLPGNVYTAGLNFAVIAPDGDGNARVTFTAAPALGVDNLAFEVLVS